MAAGFLEELEAHTEVRLSPAAANALRLMRDPWTNIGGGNDVTLAFADQLAADQTYTDFACRILALADARLAAIHDGTEPFVADRAFSAADARVLERAALVGLVLDADWAAPIPRLLGRASVAPNTTAKSVPSQAAAYALARAILVAPTPETVAGLAEATRTTRHGGIKKKFTRYIREARRRVATRPDVALRLPLDSAPTKAQLTTWKKALEASWLASASWAYDAWIDTAFAAPVSGFSQHLIWQVTDGPAVLGRPDAFEDFDGATVSVPPDSRIRLWHPAAATAAERERWRGRARKRQLEQPFAQVFREHYTRADINRLIVDDSVVDALQLIGVYRSEGWRSDGDGSISRSVGTVGATMWFDGPVFPGAGFGQRRPLGLRVGRPSFNAQGNRTLEFDDANIDPAAVSEILRSADLILSASTVAHEDCTVNYDAAPETPAGVLATRRVVLQHILADLPPTASIQFVGRYIEVNGFRVNLATGRVTRDGDPVNVTPKKRLNLWQPVSDRLLTVIVGTVVALLDEASPTTS